MRSRFQLLAVLSLIACFNPLVSNSVAQECVDAEGDGSCVDAGCAVGAGAVGPLTNGVPGSNRPCCWYQPFTEQSQPDVFYNYYVPNNQGATAAAFPAPYPTPSLVGHTYYTYQPLMPNEFLYRHHRSYHQYYNNGMGLNRTRVAWHYNPIPNVFLRLHRMTVWK